MKVELLRVPDVGFIMLLTLTFSKEFKSSMVCALYDTLNRYNNHVTEQNYIYFFKTLNAEHELFADLWTQSGL